MLSRLFLRHPRLLGETYVQHQASALAVAWTLLCAAAACFVHALAPGLFESTASRLIRRLDQTLSERGVRRANPSEGAADHLEYQI